MGGILIGLGEVLIGLGEVLVGLGGHPHRPGWGILIGLGEVLIGLGEVLIGPEESLQLLLRAYHYNHRLVYLLVPITETSF